jgi:hypothetical protein
MAQKYYTVSWDQLHRDAKVLSTDYEGNDILLRAVVPPMLAGRLEPFVAQHA